MFVKIFEQILDSSIAENYELRHFFEDLLKLADKTGVVDMTPEAISRRINLPLEKVILLLDELGRPDPKSRSPGHEGRRIISVDSHRDWGWIIVNYVHYRAIRDEESRRAYNRDAKRKERAKKSPRKRAVVLPEMPGDSVLRLEKTHGVEAATRLQEYQEQYRQDIRKELSGHD